MQFQKHLILLAMLLWLPFFLESVDLSQFTSPIPIADLEGEPSTIVNGVNVISGDYCEYDRDMTLPGVHPLVLDRSCYSSDTRSDGTLSRTWNFNFANILVLDGDETQCRARLLEGCASLALEFSGDKQRRLENHGMKISHHMIENGVTNTSSGLISGRTNLKNVKAFWPAPRKGLVITGSGKQLHFGH